jgi:hypothetical protein
MGLPLAGFHSLGPWRASHTESYTRPPSFLPLPPAPSFQPSAPPPPSVELWGLPLRRADSEASALPRSQVNIAVAFTVLRCPLMFFRCISSRC